MSAVTRKERKINREVDKERNSCARALVFFLPCCFLALREGRCKKKIAKKIANNEKKV